VGGQRFEESSGHRLPPLGVVLLPKADTLARLVEVSDTETEGTASACAGFEVEPEKKRVQCRVIATVHGHVVNLGDLLIGEEAAARREPTWLLDSLRRIFRDVSVLDGNPEEGTKRTHAVLLGGDAVATVRPDHGIHSGGIGECTELRRLHG
jgi:hypothetical protein